MVDKKNKTKPTATEDAERIEAAAHEQADAGAPNTALAVVGIDENTPVALQLSRSEFQKLFEENIGNARQIALSDFDRLKIPAGGVIKWEIPDVESEGGTRSSPTLDCIIMAFEDNKAFWLKSFEETGGGTPPDCSSFDMVHGIGNPGFALGDESGIEKDETGWLCETCPNNRFGSAPNGGQGKACKDIRLHFLVQPEELLPIFFVAPPSSLKPLRSHNMGLLKKQIPYYGAITRLTLIEDKSKPSADGKVKGGIKYAKVQAQMIRRLTPAELERARAYSEKMKPALERVRTQITDSDYANSQGAES